MTELESMHSLLRLDGKVAVVTGGAMGIGAAIAERMAEAGASVIISDVQEAAATKEAARIDPSGARVRSLRADVADPADAARTMSFAMEEFGRLDALVNNAGIFPFSPVLGTSVDLWDRVLSVNLRGAFLHAQAFARELKKAAHGGVIVNVASVDAFRPTGALAHYDASKGGLAMLTRSLALELAPLGIRVNAIAPGGINTPGAAATTASAMGASTVSPDQILAAFLARIPLRRMGDPDEIARAAVFLATPASSYVTGAILVVDGGFLVG